MEKEKKEAGMQKKNFKDGIRLSPLGMGAMRLPQTEEGFAKPIDEPRAQEIIDFCIQHGVNYFDTAYIYHGGQSETFLGKALKKYPRENYFVADKFNQDHPLLLSFRPVTRHVAAPTSSHGMKCPRTENQT